MRWNVIKKKGFPDRPHCWYGAWPRGFLVPFLIGFSSSHRVVFFGVLTLFLMGATVRFQKKRWSEKSIATFIGFAVGWFLI